MKILILFCISLILLSGCSATFDEREYTLDKIPPTQIKIINVKEGFVYVGDFCYGASYDSCLFTAKYKLKAGEY